MKLFDQIHTRSVKRPRRILFYGIRGIGTSTLAAGLRAPVLIPTDESTNHIACTRFPVCRRFDQVMQALQDLYVGLHEYATVILDSLESVELSIGDELCRAAMPSTLRRFPTDRPWRWRIGKSCSVGWIYCAVVSACTSFWWAMRSSVGPPAHCMADRLPRGMSPR